MLSQAEHRFFILFELIYDLITIPFSLVIFNANYC